MVSKGLRDYQPIKMYTKLGAGEMARKPLKPLLTIPFVAKHTIFIVSIGNP